MRSKEVLLFAMSVSIVSGQRPPFAGSRPIGFPEVVKPTTEGLGNRFGEDEPATTVRLPIEANGDKDLVDRLSKLPIDQQPFWLINWQALEEHRKNPQTFDQKPNVFIDPSTIQQQPMNNQQQTMNNRQQANNIQVVNRNQFLTSSATSDVHLSNRIKPVDNKDSNVKTNKPRTPNIDN